MWIQMQAHFTVILFSQVKPSHAPMDARTFESAYLTSASSSLAANVERKKTILLSNVQMSSLMQMKPLALT